MLVSLLHAWLSISIRADQIISGTIINIFAFGLTGYLNRLIISRNPRLGAGIFQPASAPGCLVDLPFVGWLFSALLRPRPDHDLGPIPGRPPPGPAVPLALGPPDASRRRASQGRRDGRASTSSSSATATSILGGVFAGLAGAYLTLEQSGSFQNGMTSGRGFIALAAVIFGRWTPIGAFGAALLFTASEALRVAISLAPPRGELGDVLRAIPPEFYGRAALSRHAHRPRGRRRTKRRAGGRRPAVRPGGPDLIGVR